MTDTDTRPAALTDAEAHDLYDAIAEGAPVTADQFEAATEWARAKKRRLPKAAPGQVADEEVAVGADAAPAEGEDKSKARTRADNRGATCKVDGCDRPASALGLCKKHHTAHWRKDPVNLEKTRAAARKHSAKVRLADLAGRDGATSVEVWADVVEVRGVVEVVADDLTVGTEQATLGLARWPFTEEDAAAIAGHGLPVNAHDGPRPE